MRALKMVLLGIGIGVASTLVAVKLDAEYWRNRVQENAQVHMSSNFLLGSRRQLPPPPVPGSRSLAAEMQQLENVPVRDLAGREVRLLELRGRPVFLNLWETSCVPCVLELPSIKNLAISMRDEPVHMLVVAFEDKARVSKFMESRHELHDLPVYVAEERKAPTLLKGRGAPQTFILDRNGAVIFHHTGAADWDNDDVRAYLRGLMR